jgi:hypothetical protein
MAYYRNRLTGDVIQLYGSHAIDETVLYEVEVIDKALLYSNGSACTCIRNTENVYRACTCFACTSRYHNLCAEATLQPELYKLKDKVKEMEEKLSKFFNFK